MLGTFLNFRDAGIEGGLSDQDKHLFLVYILISMKTVPKMTFSGLWVRTFIMYLWAGCSSRTQIRFGTFFCSCSL